MCVFRKLSQVSGSHFYNEKSSSEVQLNKTCVWDSDQAISQPEQGCWLRFHRSVWLATVAKSLYAGSGCCLLEFKPFPAVLPTTVTCPVEALSAVLIIEAKDHYCQAANRNPNALHVAHPLSLLQLHQLPQEQSQINKIPALIPAVQTVFLFLHSGSPCMISFCLHQTKEELYTL